MSARVTNFLSESSIGVVYILTVVLCVAAYVLLQPRLSARLFPSIQAQRVEHFISDITAQQTIDPYKFWEFRDLYSRGTFSYNPDIIMPFSILQLYRSFITPTKILAFTSPNINSSEVLVHLTSTEKTNITLPAADEKTEILLSTKTAAAYIDHTKGTLELTFIEPLSEVKQYNGLLNYDDEHKYLNNTHMITSASITIE